jgi:hypothetical protein
MGNLTKALRSIGPAVMVAFALVAAALWHPMLTGAECTPTEGLCGDGQEETFDCPCGDGHGDSMSCGPEMDEACGDEQPDSMTCGCGNGVADSNNCGEPDCGSEDSCTGDNFCNAGCGNECDLYCNMLAVCDPACGGSTCNDGCGGECDLACNPLAACDTACGGSPSNDGCDDPCADPFEATCNASCGGDVCNPGCGGSPEECCSDPFEASCNPDCGGDVCNDGCGGSPEECDCDPCDAAGDCYDPSDPSCEDCGQPEGGVGECCAGSWCDGSNGATCMDRDICSGETCSGTDTVCAVAITNSCNDDTDCCDVCDPEGSCYAGDEWCPPQECEFNTDWSVTLECHGEESTYSGTQYSSYPEPCPSNEEVASQVQAQKSQEVSDAHPCPLCPFGTEECDGQCVAAGSLCCTFGTEACGDQCVESGSCGVTADYCANFDGEQDQAWLDAHPEFSQSGGDCVCAGVDQQICNVDEPMCISNTECCQPDLYYYCPGAGSCIPNGEDCGGSCEDGYTYCDALDECVESATYDEVCVSGCYGYQQEGAYCTEIADQYGTLLAPWDGGSGVFDGLDGELSAQASARDDGSAATPYYPIYGSLTKSGEECSGTVCAHGEECQLYVGEGGLTATSCAEIVCDPCVVDGGCYDADQCTCDPEVEVCCEPGEEGCIDRGVSIEVLPNIIDLGQSCLVLWTSSGMSAAEIVGEDVDTSVSSNLAGAMLVTPTGSSLYKIVGTGTDGLSYEAVDLCAMNPIIKEF